MGGEDDVEVILSQAVRGGIQCSTVGPSSAGEPEGLHRCCTLHRIFDYQCSPYSTVYARTGAGPDQLEVFRIKIVVRMCEDIEDDCYHSSAQQSRTRILNRLQGSVVRRAAEYNKREQTPYACGTKRASRKQVMTEMKKSNEEMRSSVLCM